MAAMIETQRLLLLPSHPRLAANVAAYYTRNREFLQPFDPARTEGFYTARGQRFQLAWDRRDAKAGRSARFWLRTKESEAIIGMVGLNNIIYGSLCSAFVAYKLDKEFLRQGFITEALEKLIEIAFGPLRLHRLEADILPDNEASMAVAQKLGFCNEGISQKFLEIDGEWRDLVRMALINDG